MKYRRTGSSIFVVCALVLIASCTSSSHRTAPTAITNTTTTASVRSTGCNRPPIPGGVSTRTLRSGARTRTYELTVPKGYTGRTPLPVIFALHALSVSYTAATALAGFDAMAKRYAYITVAPSGLLDGPTPYWLAAPVSPNYDVQYIKDLLDWLETNLCVDTSRVYSTGQSNGAQMSSVLACELSERVTAVAPVDGAEFYDVCRGRPVPVIAFHGTADPFVPYKGGGLNSETIAEQNYWKGSAPANLPATHGVDASMQTWALHNGCDPIPRERRVAYDVRERTWLHCKADTVLYIVDGGGHTWPGHPVPGSEKSFGYTTTNIDATSLMFAFFFAHRQ